MDYSRSSFEKAYTYTGGDLGALWSPECTRFRVWAPTASAVRLRFYPDGGDSAPIREYPMTPGSEGTWTLSLDGDLHGVYYTYLVTVDGITRESIDPYARAGGVNGLRGMVIDLGRTDPDGWASDRGPRMAITDAVIWEVHVRDLSIHPSSGMENKGKYLALTEENTATAHGFPTGLAHIKALGVTHVQLLPIYDYGSVDEACPDRRQYNWGYDPVNFNFPEGSYSSDPFHGEVRVRELKEAIHALHKNGIGVIMDVVYNHVYRRDDFGFNKIVPGYFSRGTSNGSCCGNDTASERSMVRKFIVDSLCYWAEEYHLDGFRFDLAGIIDADTIRLARQALERKTPGLLLYGEGWTMNTVVTKQNVSLATQKNAPSLPGFGFFNDTIRDLVRGPLFETTDPGFASGAFRALSELASAFAGRPGWTENPGQSINYCSCHDNYTLADRIALARPGISKQELARRNRLAAAFCILSQGVPFFQAGEEMLRSKPSGRGGFVDNSYRSSDRVNALRWNTFESPDALQTLRYYQGLIALRKEFPLFRLTSRAQIDEKLHSFPCGGAHTPGFLLEDSGRRLLVIFHPEDTPLEVSLPQGTWNALVWDNDAGTRILFQAEGRILLPPVAAAVLTAYNTTRTKFI